MPEPTMHERIDLVATASYAYVVRDEETGAHLVAMMFWAKGFDEAVIVTAPRDVWDNIRKATAGA